MSYTRSKLPAKKHYGLYVAEIMGVADGHGEGRLQVFIADIHGGSQAERQNPRSWTIAQYCSPFMGATSVYGLEKNKETFEGTQTSYGMWMVPPDVGTKVIVGFVNGDITNCFWLGSYPQAYSDVMIPGHASGNAHTNAGKGDKISTKVPVAEGNRTLDEIVPHQAVNDGLDLERLRPYSKYVADGLVRQGLVEDPVRGTTTASARRGSPSNVYGISTPGPVVQGEVGKNSAKRKGGHSFMMDDQDGEEKIRLRTRSGAQLILDESNGIVYMVNRDGTAWFEMDADGNIDMFSSKSITMRAEEDFNIRADRNITMEAGQNIYMKASQDYINTGKHPADPQGGSGGDIILEARNNFEVVARFDTKLTSEEGNLDVNINKGTKIKSGEDIHIKTDQNIFAQATDNINIKSDAQIRQSSLQGNHIGDLTEVVINSTDIQLNDGPATPADPATDADEVTPLATEQKTNIEYQDLGLPYDGSSNDIKSAISALAGRIKENAVTTIIKRWITREPSPDKKRN